MNDILDTIRTAIEPRATQEARAAGASACRAVLAVLEPTPPNPPAPALAPETVQQLVGVLRTMDMDQLLDTAIAKLRALGTERKPQVTAPPTARPLSIPLVPLPRAAK